MRVFAHFRTIQKEPGKFIMWILASIVLSLSTIWLPTLIGNLAGKDVFDVVMKNNPVVIFSIVFLCNTVFNSINYSGAGSNDFAVSLRGITIIIAVLYLIFLSAIIPVKVISDISLDQSIQFILLSITIFIGVFVYGFRGATWEKSVSAFSKKQEQDVTTMTTKAETTTTDGKGVNV